MSEQLNFDFEANSEKVPEHVPDTETGDKSEEPLKIRDIRRAVMAWLVDQNVSGLASMTPTRISKYRADLAAFWSRPVSKSNMKLSRLLRPKQTIIVECRRSRQDCWPDCQNSDDLGPKLGVLKSRQREFQKDIRENEPQLRQNDALFEEYTDWDYASSSNADYHDLCRQIRKHEEALYKGTRFESIYQAGLGNLNYLAVPAGIVKEHELAEGWGLLWVHEDMRIELVSTAPEQECDPLGQLHLIQNIAIAARESVLFANGIREKNGETHFLPIPRRRRVK